MNKILSVFAALVTITTLMVNLETITSWLTPEVPKNTTPVPHTANPNIPSDTTDERDQNHTTKSSTPKVSKPKLPKSKPIKPESPKPKPIKPKPFEPQPLQPKQPTLSTRYQSPTVPPDTCPIRGKIRVNEKGVSGAKVYLNSDISSSCFTKSNGNFSINIPLTNGRIRNISIPITIEYNGNEFSGDATLYNPNEDIIDIPNS